MKIFVNGRFTSHRVTGIQRYAHEVSSRLASQVKICQPSRKLRGWKGHLWEQTVLPFESRSGVLWSPCASGPLNGPPQIVTFHDLFPLECALGFGRTFVNWYRVMLGKLARACKRIIAVSEYTKGRLTALLGMPPEKITVVLSGVDEEFFNISGARVSAAAAALTLPSKRYFLYVGSLEPRKNLRRLLAAWSRAYPQLPADVWLVVSGSCDKNVYEGAGLGNLPARVHLTGYVPDHHLPGLYGGSLGLLYPSLAEGFGFPPLEAMAAGVPVLTSNTTALPEICGAAALYVDPTAIEQIASGIVNMANSPAMRETLRTAGLNQARRFTWERTAAQTYSVLESEARAASARAVTG